MILELRVEGMTIQQASKAWGVSVTQVRRWITEGRLNVVQYANGKDNGRGKNEPLLVLIQDKKRPERRQSWRTSRRR